MSKRHALWLAAAALALALLGALLALPGFVASQAHRPAMESFASALIGRKVEIGGKLSLALLPRPAVTATDITITGPGQEVITARALAMEIAPLALLRGRLAVRTLNLDQPNIIFPWPLPGGAQAIAPPPFLAALHAHLNKGAVRLGGVSFSEVNADLFTAPDGALSLAGNGAVLGQGVALTLALGAANAAGDAPLALRMQGLGSSLDFSGTLAADSRLSGKLTAKLPQGVTAAAALGMDAHGLIASQLAVQQGQASLTGSATLSFAPLALSARLSAQNLDLDALAGMAQPLAPFAPALPLALEVQASNITLAGRQFPALQASVSTGPGGLALNRLTLALPGGATLNASGSASPAGALSGQASLMVPDSAALASAYHLAPPAAWPTAKLTAQLGGTFTAPVLDQLTGTLGPDQVSGHLVLGAGRAAGWLAFDHLDLAPLFAWAGQRPADGFIFDGEISAARAEAGPLRLQNLAVDAALDGVLNIRRVSANLYGGQAAGGFTLDASGQVAAAHGFVQIPAATPLAALLPARWAPPAALTAGRLSLRFAAQGPANALAASMVASLAPEGNNTDLARLTITASPVIDLIHHSASGAVSVQFPTAIRLARLLGFNADAAFPGPGSASLRAGFTASSGQFGLNDFILSFGALAANGRVLVAQGKLSGQIAADRLALPQLPDTLILPAALPLTGQVNLTASQVIYAGAPLFGPAQATLTLGADRIKLDLARAALGQGSLSGSLTAMLPTQGAAQFNLSLLAQGLDAAALPQPRRLKLRLNSGSVDASLSLTASGTDAKAWLATLGGSASLTAKAGRLGGISLGNAAAGGHAVLGVGSTAFTAFNAGCTLAAGICTLTQAGLSGPEGGMSATGRIDFVKQHLALRLILQPKATPHRLAVPLYGSW